jgi:hypothetical protein
MFFFFVGFLDVPSSNAGIHARWKKNFDNLMRYAKELGIEENVRIYADVML